MRDNQEEVVWIIERCAEKIKINFIKDHINSDHIFTGLNQFWRLIYGLVTLILIPLFLTQEEQGYWFTMTSLAALMILADLGFTNIVLQFAAHEFAYLRFSDQNQLVGEEKHLKKLATFFSFSIKWAIFLICLSFPIILGIGFYILSQKATNINWSLPWIIYMIGSSLIFFNGVILSFIEGCDSVSTVQKIRLSISALTAILMWIGLFLGLNLFSLSISILLGASIGFFLIYKKFKGTINNLILVSRSYIYSWKKEFFSLLWKYAISWASGYFIFQIYTPLMFHYHGAVEAGKVGLSITLWTAVFSIANIWVYVIIPKLNMLVSKKDWKSLDSLFFKNLMLSCFTFLIGMATIFVLLYLLNGKVPLVNRFVNKISMFFLAAAWFLQLVVNNFAVYLRAHKEEPYVLTSFMLAIYIIITTFICIRYLSTEYFFLGYLSSYIWGFPWALYIFIRKRKIWHIA